MINWIRRHHRLMFISGSILFITNGLALLSFAIEGTQTLPSRGFYISLGFCLFGLVLVFVGIAHRPTR